MSTIQLTDHGLVVQLRDAGFYQAAKRIEQLLEENRQLRGASSASDLDVETARWVRALMTKVDVALEPYLRGSRSQKPGRVLRVLRNTGIEYMLELVEATPDEWFWPRLGPKSRKYLQTALAKYAEAQNLLTLSLHMKLPRGVREACLEHMRATDPVHFASRS